MADLPRSATRPLPIIPQHLLRKHRVLEKYDNRFQACARMLQALWRERQELPIGTFTAPDGKTRRIGSLISAAAAEDGRNFLAPQVAHLARTEMAFREAGALIDQARLFGNLLTSSALVHNLFAPLRLSAALAARVMRRLLPELDIQEVKQVLFEHSPGRGDPALTGDRTAFDVAIIYKRSDGREGFIGFEVKYSESMREAARGELGEPLVGLARASGLFKAPASAVLRVAPLQQLFREHLLTQAALTRGDWAEATFCLLAPRHNHLVQTAAGLYTAHLAGGGGDRAAFVSVELELMIDAIARSGEQDYAHALHDRYCDWSKLDTLTEEALAEKLPSWSIVPPRSSAPLALIPQAA